MKDRIKSALKDSIKVQEELLASQVDAIERIASLIIDAVRSGGKLLVFGNGGSAADSQHIAAELVARFKRERPSIPAIALPANMSTITALANDYGYDVSFKRQVEGLGRRGDVAMGISTSGNAVNVLEALKLAKEMGLKIVTMTGKDGGKISALADAALKAPSRDTPRIQEAHITAAHIICGLIEDGLYG